MKTLHRFASVVAALGLLILTGGTAFAQTTLTNTTLSAAITNPYDQTMTVASVTGWSATSASGQAYALIDREVVGVRAVNTTTKVVTITRGQQGTRATGHPSSATVYFIDPTLSTVVLADRDRSGACSTTGNADISQNALYVPVFNPSTGRSFTCTSGGIWVMSADYMGTAVCAVTQATNRTTGVTCTGTRGVITTNAASLAAEASADFVVTDSLVAITDVIDVSQRSGSNGGGTIVTVVGVAAGTFTIRVHNGNVAAGTAETGAIILNFKVIKD
jgi:hypothetical protein